MGLNLRHVWFFGEYWACINFSLSLVILYPLEGSSHGLWSLYLPMACTLALVYPDLIPSFIGSEGFKVSVVVDELVISHRFCLQSRFEWHRLIQTYMLSRGFHWRFSTDH